MSILRLVALNLVFFATASYSQEERVSVLLRVFPQAGAAAECALETECILNLEEITFAVWAGRGGVSLSIVQDEMRYVFLTQTSSILFSYYSRSYGPDRIPIYDTQDASYIESGNNRPAMMLVAAVRQ